MAQLQRKQAVELYKLNFGDRFTIGQTGRVYEVNGYVQDKVWCTYSVHNKAGVFLRSEGQRFPKDKVVIFLRAASEQQS